MTRLTMRTEGSALYKFAYEAHNARFPAFAWKAVACDMMGLPMGSRPTSSQIIEQPNGWSTLWLELTLRFDQMSTVRWAEHVECEQERIHNTLRYLGYTPDRVAESLSMMGVMGNPLESCDCPLVHFLAGVYGSWFTRVANANVWVDFVKVGNPPAVEGMVRAFDEGQLSKLDLFPDRVGIL